MIGWRYEWRDGLRTLSELERQSVVYRIPCKDCTGAYVGQTGRSLGQRLKEHKRALKN